MAKHKGKDKGKGKGKGKAKGKGKGKARSAGPTLAQRADKHVLYEQAVQCVEAEIDFVDATYRKLRGHPAEVLREDFCGTTNSSCEWVRRNDANVAYSVDIDPEVLEWGRQHHVAQLKPDQADRIHLINANVLEDNCPAVDVVLAMNFSYWVFKTRQQMLQYFRHIHAGLKPDGVLFLDAFGGYEAFQNLEESTKFKGFTYIWDQAEYNPITGDAVMHIHFKFKDGSRIQPAFSYHWRQWTLPELTELLEEAGFSAQVYWEGEDSDGEGNGVFTPSTQGTADAGWIAYIVAVK